MDDNLEVGAMIKMIVMIGALTALFGLDAWLVDYSPQPRQNTEQKCR